MFEVDNINYQKIVYSKKRKQISLKEITAIVLGHDFIGQTVSKDNPSILKEIKKLVFVKARDWKYEEEYRVVHTTEEIDGDSIIKSNEKVYLRMPKIKRVYMGCRYDAKSFNDLKKQYPHIDFVILEDSNTEYKVSIKN